MVVVGSEISFLKMSSTVTLSDSPGKRRGNIFHIYCRTSMIVSNIYIYIYIYTHTHTLTHTHTYTHETYTHPHTINTPTHTCISKPYYHTYVIPGVVAHFGNETTINSGR